MAGFFILALLFCATGSCEENTKSKKKNIYVYKNDRGTLVFTDQARPGARLVNMNHNTLTMPATNTNIVTAEPTSGSAAQYKVAITRPTAQQTIRDNNGVVQVSGQISPQLGQGHKFRLKLDGEIRQKPHSNAHFVLRNVDRGEHQVVLELLNAKEEVIAASEAITFQLFRASILHNKSQN
jgi:hypothetical protein